jgi:hypothetical protein
MTGATEGPTNIPNGVGTPHQSGTPAHSIPESTPARESRAGSTAPQTQRVRPCWGVPRVRDDRSGSSRSVTRGDGSPCRDHPSYIRVPGSTTWSTRASPAGRHLEPTERRRPPRQGPRRPRQRRSLGGGEPPPAAPSAVARSGEPGSPVWAFSRGVSHGVVRVPPYVGPPARSPLQTPGR